MTQTAYPIPATGPNWPLINATRTLISELPETSQLDPDVDSLPDDERGWNQNSYRCDTGRCFAGWAATLAGAVFTHGVYTGGCVDIDHKTNYGGTIVIASSVVEVAAETWHVADYAQRALGITASERVALFDGDNTLADIDRILNDIRDANQVEVDQ